METPLTPLDFLRRARKLHPGREAVVDGDSRFTYAEFGARCDRWSSALQALGVGQGDRVATIALNTHEHLEQYYAVPQIGAVVVPLNYRLAAEDFVYLITHSGSKVVCVAPDFMDAVDSVRRSPALRAAFRSTGTRPAGVARDTTCCLTGSTGEFQRPEIAESDPISINYTSGTTAKPRAS